MLSVQTNYVSCIKIKGIPILPPLVTSDYRKELLKYKEQALMIEKDLQQRKGVLFTTKVKDISNENTYQKTKYAEKNIPTVDCSSQTVQHCVPSTLNEKQEDTKKRDINLTCCILDVAEFSDNGCKVVNHNGVSYTSDEPAYSETDQEESTRHDAKSSIMSEDGEFFNQTPRLKRSASYILENPSPILLAHLEKHSVYSPSEDFSVNTTNMSHSFTEGLTTFHKEDCNPQTLFNKDEEYQLEIPKYFEEGSSDGRTLQAHLNLETNDFTKPSSQIITPSKLYDYNVMSLKPPESVTRETYFTHYPFNNFSHIPLIASECKENTGEFLSKSFTVKDVQNKVPYQLTIEEDCNPKVPPVVQEVDVFDNQESDNTELVAVDSSFYELVQDLKQPQSIPLSEDSVTTTIIRTETVEYIDKIISNKSYTNPEISSQISPQLNDLVPVNTQLTQEISSGILNHKNKNATAVTSYPIEDTAVPVRKSMPAAKVVVEKITSIRISKGPVDPYEKKEWAASVIGAAIRGYLTRRLMKTDKVQSLIQTIQDAVLCAVQLHEVKQLEEADVELHRRLIQQVSAACYAFHDVFFSLTRPEQMSIIATDRKKKIEKAKKCLLNTIHGH